MFHKSIAAESLQNSYLFLTNDILIYIKIPSKYFIPLRCYYITQSTITTSKNTQKNVSCANIPKVELHPHEEIY